MKLPGSVTQILLPIRCPVHVCLSVSLQPLISPLQPIAACLCLIVFIPPRLPTHMNFHATHCPRRFLPSPPCPPPSPDPVAAKKRGGEVWWLHAGLGGLRSPPGAPAAPSPAERRVRSVTGSSTVSPEQGDWWRGNPSACWRGGRRPWG